MLLGNRYPFTVIMDTLRRFFQAHGIRGPLLLAVSGGGDATAHQKNDQAETVLMRLMTGGGLAALRGIHSVRDDGIIRPLLGIRRSEIDAFLRERKITPRSDSSNRDA